MLYLWRASGEVSQGVGSEYNPLILNKHAAATITVGRSSRRRQIHLPLNPHLFLQTLFCLQKQEFVCKAAGELYSAAESRPD